MRNLIVILSLFLMIVSCSVKMQTDYETEIVMKIMNQTEFADSNLAILNFKQGQITQYTHNDTVDVLLNGFVYFHLKNRPDNPEFNMFPENLKNFEFQGLWENEKLNIKSLSIDNLTLLDSVPELENEQLDSLYNFDWSTIPSEINGLTSFSKPILDEDGKGLIAQMIYTRKGKLYMKLYSLKNSEENDFSEIGCLSFDLIGFYIFLNGNEIKNIEPSAIIVDSSC